MVPADFLTRCAKEGRPIDVSRMRQNPPQSWVAEARSYNPPIPLAALVGYGLIALFVVLVIVLLV
jgi:hypothetical protein